MSNDDKFKINANSNAQDPLSPPPISNEDSAKELTPNAAFSTVKNSIFRMYNINSDDEKNQK